MRISYDWLQELLPGLQLSPAEVAGALTGIGLEVENLECVEAVRGGLADLIVGKVLTCEPHGNADRLRITHVDVGTESPLKIVCGAPNVQVGQRVVVARHGVRIFPYQGGEILIKRSKVRGELSEGMLCAEDEIGIGQGHEGILTLGPEAVVGSPARDWLGIRTDYVLEIGLTANRADAMSHFGVARDLAAFLQVKENSPLRARLPELRQSWDKTAGNGIKLGVIDPTVCPGYCGLTLRGVHVEESPKWLSERLRAIGLHPINNVVDVTNYVLHELGQPLHAFDAAQIKGGVISVGCLPKGSTLVTLDGRARTLRGDEAIILDGDRGLCLGGVLGGADSGVSSKTTDLFLEAAIFDAARTRRTSRAHGITTDASYRFERGVDSGLTRIALQRAAELILDLAGGRIEGGIVSKWHIEEGAHRTVRVRQSGLTRLLGIDLNEDILKRAFNALEMRISPVNAGVWDLDIPCYRVDVTREADVAEEVLRLWGYDRVPMPNTLRVSLPVGNSSLSPSELEARVGDALVGRGFHEIMGLSLVPSARVESLQNWKEKEVVMLQNPLSGDLNAIRPTLLLGALDAVGRNAARQRPDLRLFEFGNVTLRDEKASSSTNGVKGYRERRLLALTMHGAMRPALWNGPSISADIYALRGVVEGVLEQMGISENSLTYESISEGYFAEGALMRLDNTELCRFGRVREEVTARHAIKGQVFYAELEWDKLRAVAGRLNRTFRPLPRFPEVRRDLALILDQGVKFADLREAARRAERKLLRRVELFDCYEGPGIPKGKVSYALAFTLQGEKGTLTDAEIDRAMGRILDELRTACGATLRG